MDEAEQRRLRRVARTILDLAPSGPARPAWWLHSISARERPPAAYWPAFAL